MPTDGAGTEVRRKAAPSRIGYLVVTVGDCAGCIKADLARWQREAKARDVSMVLLSSASAVVADKFRRQLKLSVPIVVDPGMTLEKRLNFVWFGRPYLYSPDWKLVWLTRRIVLDSPFVENDFEQALSGGKR